MGVGPVKEGKDMKHKTYTKIEVEVGGNIVLSLADTKLNDARMTVRRWLDTNKHAYAVITAYIGDRAVKSTWVGPTCHRSNPAD